MPDEVYDKVIALAKKEKRKKSAMCSILIDEGFNLFTNFYPDILNLKK